jgi:hypothetical protein
MKLGSDWTRQQNCLVEPWTIVGVVMSPMPSFLEIATWEEGGAFGCCARFDVK